MTTTITSPIYFASLPIGTGFTTNTLDAWVFQGSSTKTIKILGMWCGNYNGSCNCIDGYQLLRRNTANSGGQNVPMLLGQRYIGDPAPVSAPFYYTYGNSASVTTGHLVSTIQNMQYRDNDPSKFFDYYPFPVVLSGTNDYMTYFMNLGDQPAFYTTVVFTEY